MPSIFNLKSIDKFFGEQTLFMDLSTNAHEGERIGLIGGNGSGKSTLLRILAGLEAPDDGDVTIKNLTRLVYLPQDDNLEPENSVLEILTQSLEAEPIEEQERHRRIQRMLGMGGFTDIHQQCGTLSGGWKKRLAITRALALAPDLLLLDEPTNHLDIQGILWLEKILGTAKFTFVVVSHDRQFLENACQNIMELGQYYPDGYLKVDGGYITFSRRRGEFLENQQKQEIILSNKMKRETEWLSQGVKARTTKAKFRINQAEKLRLELGNLKQRNRHVQKVDLSFNGTDRKTKRLLVARNLGHTIEGRELFKEINLELTPGTRLGLIGENGSGKTTLMNLLEGTILPESGTIKLAENLRVAIFDQTRSRLDPEITLKEALSPAGESVIYQNRSIHVVSWAKRFLFTPDQLLQPVGWLSGGEKARILLANLMRQPADLLLLDEPTNDLDIPSLEVLEESLMEFPGAVVLVSHDRFLLDRVTNKILYLDGKGGSEIYADHHQCLLETPKNEPGKKSAKKPKPTKPKTPANRLSYKHKFELEQMEDKIMEAEAEVEKLDTLVADPEVMADPERLSKCCMDLQQAQDAVEQLYTRWEELEAMNETASKK